MDKPQSFEEVFKDAYDYWIDDADIHRYEGAKGLADQVWQHQQSKVEELQVQLNGAQERAQLVLQYKDKYRLERDDLQKRVDKATRKWIAVTSIATTCPNQLPDEFFKKLDELHDALCGVGLEQALKGEGQ